MHRALVLSLDAPCGEEDGDPLTLADGLIETSDVDPSMQIEEREQAAYLRDALELLPERLQTVVKGYFLEGRTSADLAEELAVTESRVSQMRSEGLALMRAGLQAQFDGSAGACRAAGEQPGRRPQGRLLGRAGDPFLLRRPPQPAACRRSAPRRCRPRADGRRTAPGISSTTGSTPAATGEPLQDQRQRPRPWGRSGR